MRTLIALLTLGAGGAGYVYLQQTPASGESGSQQSAARSFFDSSISTTTKADSPRGSVKDLVNQIHEHTKSILDDFANQHGGHSDAPADNAYQRLKQVTQLADASIADSSRSVTGDLSQTKSPRSPASNLDELQRLAFDPAAVVDSSGDPVIERNTVSPNSTSREPAAPIHVVAGSLEPTSKTGQPGSRKNRGAVIPETQSSNIATAGPNSKRPITSVASGASPKIPGAEWTVVGKTTERRPMHSMHLGKGGTRTLVIAGLDGQDRVAVRWLEQLADALAKRPDLLDNNEVLFFRAGNPDGLVRKVQGNARGVPLNRNFPNRRNRLTMGLPSSFAIPASEVETQVILNSLNSFRPRRVIHLVSTSARSQVLYNRLAKDLANELERSATLRIVPLDAEHSSGSIEDYADGTLEAAVLSIRLNIGTDWQQTWTNHQPQILSALVGRPIGSEDDKTIVPHDPDRTPLPLPNVEPISRRPGRRGYEELSPPPE